MPTWTVEIRTWGPPHGHPGAPWVWSTYPYRWPGATADAAAAELCAVLGVGVDRVVAVELDAAA